MISNSEARKHYEALATEAADMACGELREDLERQWEAYRAAHQAIADRNRNAETMRAILNQSVTPFVDVWGTGR